jgi:hypothetical protein
MEIDEMEGRDADAADPDDEEDEPTTTDGER